MSSTQTATVYEPALGNTPRRPARPPRTSTTSKARSAGSFAGPCATTDADSPLQVVALPNLSRASTSAVISSPAIATATPKAAADAPGPLPAPVIVCNVAVHPTWLIFPASIVTSMGSPGSTSSVSTHATPILYIPATVDLNSKRTPPSSRLARCSTATPPGPDARPSNVNNADAARTSLPYRSRKISFNTPGSPALHPAKPVRSNVVAATIGSAASTNTATSLRCEPDWSKTTHFPETFETPVTSYTPLPRSRTWHWSADPCVTARFLPPGG